MKLQLTFKNLTTLEGLDFKLECNDSFKNITELDVSHNNLSEIDGNLLPNTLKTLRCWSNKLTSIVNLPDSLENLDCIHNNLTTLNVSATNLLKIVCHSNQISTLVLPKTLMYLDCRYNKNLINLQSLPLGLIDLYCTRCQFSSLPTLPESLQFLWATHNNITQISNIPYCLKKMCYNHPDVYEEEKLTLMKLEQHNEKRRCLKMEQVEQLPTIIMWEYVNNKYTKWLYRPGGEIYNKCQENVNQKLKN